MGTNYIFLMGPRACGKTSVGNAMSMQLIDWTAVDLDAEYERICFMETGRRIGTDVDAYYDRSREILFEYMGLENIIMCLGGGTLINSRKAPNGCMATLEKCRERGQIVLLLPSRFDFRNKKVLHLREKERRYSVASSTVAKHYEKRIDFYKNSADFVVYGTDVKGAATKIIKHFDL